MALALLPEIHKSWCRIYASKLSKQSYWGFLLERSIHISTSQYSEHFQDFDWDSAYRIDLNKTQRQLCKRLAGPFIPFSWSCLVWKKSFILDMITRGQSTTIFLCIGPFSAWSRTNKQTNNRVILVQACPWPVWEGSLLQKSLPSSQTNTFYF